MLYVYGPDKIGSHQSENFKKLIADINQAIIEAYGNCVTVYLDSKQVDKYKYKLKKLYTDAGWDEVDFDYDYDWENDAVKMTLQKRDY